MEMEKPNNVIVPLTLHICKVKINPLPRKSMALTDYKTSENFPGTFVEEEGWSWAITLGLVTDNQKTLRDGDIKLNKEAIRPSQEGRDNAEDGDDPDLMSPQDWLWCSGGVRGRSGVWSGPAPRGHTQHDGLLWGSTAGPWQAAVSP